MDVYEFAKNVEEWRSLVAILLKQADSVQHFARESNKAQAPDSVEASVESWELPSSQPKELMQAYEKLSVASEELHVAQKHLLQQNEELEQKNEELMVAQQIAEAECQRYQELFAFAPDGYLVTNVPAEFLERYSHKLTDERKYQHLKRIQASVSHLTQLVNDVLFINQIEVEAVEVKPTLLDLSAFCQELVEDLMLTAGSHHTIIFDSQGYLTEVYLDPKLLRQILSNLLSNAIKYSPQGGTVWFSCIGNADQVTFHIRDEGMGIPAEDLPQLMQSFYRANNAGNIPGTGLGLAIVKKCVDLHEGQISVDSKICMGTTFKVTLPLRRCIT